MNYYILYKCESCDSSMSLGPVPDQHNLRDVEPQKCLVCGKGSAVPVRLLDQRQHRRFAEADDE